MKAHFGARGFVVSGARYWHTGCGLDISDDNPIFYSILANVTCERCRASAAFKTRWVELEAQDVARTVMAIFG